MTRKEKIDILALLIDDPAFQRFTRETLNVALTITEYFHLIAAELFLRKLERKVSNAEIQKMKKGLNRLIDKTIKFMLNEIKKQKNFLLTKS